MTTTKTSMIRLDPALHRALRRKAEETDRSVTELVNDAVRERLAEDADDLSVIERRRNEPTRPFDTFVAGLRRRAKL
jgi:predicted transcriptional regulator